MSRAAVRDNSNAVSLFPFLAVLLCTMGALLVVLVAVTRLSRDHAREEVVRKRSVAAAQPVRVDDRRAQFEHVQQYLAKLKAVEAKAKQQLEDDRLRLRDLEDHMRRLQDRARSLGAAAAELDALDQQHRDDVEQAEHNAQRLEKLITDTRESIDELKEEVASHPKAYAIVPYRGPNGTYRPPIYIECRRDVVILQPEGIRLTEEDFRPPLGPGNPLAAALRAARVHFAQQRPDGDAGIEHDPYPLILIRPDGIVAYYAVRRAIESWDSNFGYEMVGGDWDLKFRAPDPQLADVETHAVELARLHKRMLAEAAPRAYGMVDDRGRGVFPSSARGVGHFEFEDDVDRYDDGQSDEWGLAGDGSGGGTGNGTDRTGNDAYGGLGDGGLAGGDGSADGTTGGESGLAGGDFAGNGNTTGGGGGDVLTGGVAGGSVLADDRGTAGAGGGPAGTPAGLGELAGGTGTGGGPATGSNGTGPGGNAVGPSDLATSEGSAGGSAAGPGQPGSTGAADGSSADTPGGSADQLAGGTASGASGGATAGGAAGGTSSVGGTASSTACSSGSCSSQGDSVQQGASSSVSMNSAIKPPPPDRSANERQHGLDPPHGRTQSVPIRRSIHLVVRSDHVAILPERTTSSAPLTGGKEIALTESTDESIDQLVSALRDHVQQWGIAGNGLFWRPVVVLNVGPDGHGRAAELERLFKRRGIELRYASTAQRDSETDSHATR